MIRDRAAKTGKMVQAGYSESVLHTFEMWDCNPVLTPLDPNVHLTKRDSRNYLHESIGILCR